MNAVVWGMSHHVRVACSVRWKRLETGGLGRENQELSILDTFILKH